MDTRSNSLLSFIESIETDVPRIVFTPSVDAAVDSIELESVTNQYGKTIVFTWGNVPRIDSAISYTVTGLAELALEQWPNWLGQHDATDLKLIRGAIAKSLEQKNLLPLWLSQSWSLCEKGRLPIIPTMSNGENVRHITSLFNAENLHIIFILQDANRDDPNLDGLCRALLWLSAHTSAQLTLLLDLGLEGSLELSSVDYKSHTWLPPVGNYADDCSSEKKSTIWPTEGKPHPASPGERLLAKLLVSDQTLSGVFKFNQPVKTVYGNTYYVDLFSVSDNAIVEVDGYTHHSSQYAFSLDRQRDYELQTSGYLVLRLPHHELMKTPAECLKKIHNLIAFQRKEEAAA